MARTLNLTNEQLDDLRKKVRAKFETENNGQPLKPSTYKEGYEDLRADILQFIPDSEASISLNRLRKLFYYTDPNICPASQFKNPVFGRDFLKVLEKYHTVLEERKSEVELIYEQRTLRSLKTTSALKKTWKKWRLGAISLLILFTSLLLLVFTTEKQPESFEEKFDHVSLFDLEKNGWEIWDLESVYLNKQRQQGYLTLYTLNGDYWVKPDEQRFIKNLLVRALDCDCCVIKTKLNSFHPDENWQQAGLFIMAKDDPQFNHFRLTVSFNEYYVPLYDSIANELKIHALVQEQGIIAQAFNDPFCFPEKLHPYQCLDSLQMKITISNGLAQYQLKFHEDWKPFLAIKEAFPLPFKPYYVGLGAFQGQTDEYGDSLCAENIPVNFDFLTVEPCQWVD